MAGASERARRLRRVQHGQDPPCLPGANTQVVVAVVVLVPVLVLLS